MSNQEIEQAGGVFTTTPTTAPATTGNQRRTTHHCSHCCNSLKRRPPLSSSFSLQELTPKKLNLQQPSTTADHLRGFTRLPLPFNFQRPNPNFSTPTSPENPKITKSFSPIQSNLRRAISDVTSPGYQEAVKAATSSVVLPPIRRGVSDVTSPAYQEVLTTITTSPPATVVEPAARSFSRSPSPYSKALQRMKEMIREISERCEEVMNGTEENEEQVKDGSENNHNHPQEGESEGDGEEAVSLGCTGEGLTIGFKCPCGKVYQLLISGNKCYYLLA